MTMFLLVDLLYTINGGQTYEYHNRVLAYET